MELNGRTLAVGGAVLIGILFLFFSRQRQTVTGGGTSINRIENPDVNFANEIQARETAGTAFQNFLGFAQGAQEERLGILAGSVQGFETALSPINREIEGRFAAFAQTPALYELATRRRELEISNRNNQIGQIQRSIESILNRSVYNSSNQIFSPGLFNFSIPSAPSNTPPINGGLIAGQYGKPAPVMGVR